MTANCTNTRILVALVTPTMLLAACGGSREKARVQPPVPVVVAKAETRTMPLSNRSIGHVEPIATVGIKARIGGDLVRVWFSEGDTVRAGQTLFTIDPRPYEAALRQAEAGLQRDKALLAKAELDLPRYAELVKQDFVTKEQNDQVMTNAASLRAAMAADQANLENARLNLDYCTIKAPVSGRTGSLNVKVGNLVKANDDKAMVTINQIRPINVTYALPAQFLPSVINQTDGHIKVRATLPGDSERPAEGALAFVDNNVDPATSTILLKATFANEDERLWPGQFVDVVTILGEESGRVVCASAAVQTGQQGQYVFVVKEDDTVELRIVRVNRMDETDAVIERGLTTGETVVTDGQLRLVPGAKVQIKNSPAEEHKP
jgi:multidrug efflux system membrane fusion protein